MNIGVIGAGWVGVTTAAALASMGHTVMCSDINAERIEKLKNGEVPFFEPGLFELLTESIALNRLRFTLSNDEVIKNAEVVFCCVNTPTGDDGLTDIRALMVVAKDFAQAHTDGAVFVIKSTVPAGTGKKISQYIQEQSIQYGNLTAFGIASNPEFLAEGTAVHDALQPSRLVLGANEVVTLEKLKQVYAPMIDKGVKVFSSDCTTAEVVKTAANSFLATRVSFINEIANYCNAVGADPMSVALGMGLDPRIGLMRPGVGYGGGCFPKDVQALLSEGNRAGTPLTVLKATHEANYRQRKLLYERMSIALQGVAGKKVAILGVAFKPKTDDVRDAPALTFIEHLLAEGATVVAYDPQVRSSIISSYPGLQWATSVLEATQDAHAVALMCEWQEFSNLDLSGLKQSMKGNVVVDGRYVWSKKVMEELGFVYVV